ncbi:3-hydroxyacyl-CoA dehydrogenase family protein [Streptomyces sp. NBC_00162]|uniref:3-hydroxyacyl-CoA dehydrogenase family protein n=1 Tax=Streptomyces sp. NBC_00162 TaxID=2903629 RepID=UPI00214CC10E|nr:3-hydroxyacyl-CoA dehydrogenase family protein [Streptomyces sp. NBC_00162]UUU45042.1 3-hydroxyacyl-CoA dehydrogenase NAD-binding domain-containing protein [Streptomyces sp. NBC_00162]
MTTERKPITGIVGLGTVGEALLRLAHEAGHEVIAVDTTLDALDRTARRLKAADAARKDETDGPARPAVTLTTDPAALSRAELVIEAVSEDEAVKKAVLCDIVARCAPGVPVLTTTTTLSVPRLAIASGSPGSVAGLRFFTPPASGGPVRPVHSPLASAATAAALDALVAELGLRPVPVTVPSAADADDLVLAYLNRAAILCDEGYASARDIDTAMRLGCGLPLGPLETLDLMGVDSVHAALLSRWRRTGDCAFEPSPLLSRMVTAGRLGRKSGEGFAAYDELGAVVTPPAGGASAGTARPVTRVGVVGSGAMARGIAEVMAVGGRHTVLVARGAEQAARALEAVGDSLTRRVRRGRITPAEREAALGRLETSHDLAALGDRDLVVEAIVEELDAKQALFGRLGEVCAPGTVLATTTSSLSVTACAEASGRPADVIGLHFFNPAPVMRLVELAHTPDAHADALATARALCRDLGKTAVECPDRTGFIVNRLLFPYLGDALDLLERADTDIAATDAAVEEGYGYPMGPFALLDTIGLDVSLAIQERLFESFELPELAPSPALAELVAAGALGRKNRRGFRTGERRG